MKHNFTFSRKIGLIAMIIVYGLLPIRTFAQQSRAYLDSLLQSTLNNYPLIKAKKLQTEALQYAVKYKKTGLIPSLNASYQVDYASYNNITGMVFPQYIIPISGPPSKTNEYKGTPGSAVALNFQWEPITFGQRSSEVNLAKGKLQYSKADEDLTSFQQQIYVIGSWLNYLLMNDLIKIYQTNIDRSAFNLKQAQALVTTGLRPGTDSSSFNSEYTRAKMQLISFERQRDSSLIALKELVGGRLPVGVIADSSLFTRLPAVNLSDASFSEHPEIQLSKANVASNQLALQSLKKSILPKLTIWSTGYGRGSGIGADGTVNAQDGWKFQRYNYGIGAQIAFPIFEIFHQKPLWRQQELLAASSREQLLQTELHLHTQQEIADSAFQKALQSARIAPQQSYSAMYSYKAIQSRYKSGLINYYDVIQSQQLLFQSEATVKIAYYNVWKTLLNKAAYLGNINLFLNQYGK